MILDTMTQFSAAQAVTAVGDTPSTNVLDTSAAADSSSGDVQYLLVRTVTPVTSGGAPTVQVVMQDSADNSAWADVMAATAALPPASLPANRLICRAPLPSGMRRYWRVAYRVGTSVLTGGSFNAYLASDVQAQQLMPSGFTVA